MRVRAAELDKRKKMKILRFKNLSTGLGSRSRAFSSAFTLIETVVSLPIVAVGLVSLYACFSEGFSVVGQSRENLRATQIMIKQVERIRLSPYTQLTNTVYNPQTVTDYFDPTDQPNGGGGTTYTITLTPTVPAVGTLPEAYRTNMLLVTLGISWPAGNPQHTNWMQAYVAQNGIQSYLATGR
jgi:hypothetical protein